MDNPQLDLARRYVESTGVSVFLTGKAGTGKTTFLRQVAERCPKRHVVLAPTGVAAVNAGGVTIHSFFQLPFDPYLPDVPELLTEYQMPQRKGLNKTRINIIRTLELLIVDEVSMVRADLLDAIDAQLRRYRRSSQPFGGVQLLLIGDVHQLSPVVTERERPFLERVYRSPYFFESKALQRVAMVTIELEHIYRQQDRGFVEILNRVRDNRVDDQVLLALNSRVGTAPEGAITLTTHNHQADAINRRHMEALQGESRVMEAIVEGTFSESAMPVDRRLTLKVGERVMFLKNDSSGMHRYFNGKLGTVTGFVRADDRGETVEVTDDDGEAIIVGREEWENVSYALGANNQIEQRVDGRFLQYPLRPAWAVTIHKAQGLTFDRVAINAADAFAFGQVYVALSRCRTLEGLTLTVPLSAHVAFGDADVSRFVESRPTFQQAASEVEAHERDYYYSQLFDLFSLDALVEDAGRLGEVYSRALKNIYPRQVEALGTANAQLATLAGVGERFRAQLGRLPVEAHAARIAKGAEYFLAQLSPIAHSLPALLEVEIDNKENARLVAERGERVVERLRVKTTQMRAVKEHGFSVAALQKARADALIDQGGAPGRTNARRGGSASRSVDASQADSSLLRTLTRWRKLKAEELGVKAFQVLKQMPLVGIATEAPTTRAELLAVAGVGKGIADRYGDEILEIVRDHMQGSGA